MTRILYAFEEETVEEVESAGVAGATDMLADSVAAAAAQHRSAAAAAELVGGSGGLVATADHVVADLVLSQEELVHDQHAAVHAFHHHMPHHAGRRGSSGAAAGLIWLLILLHLAVIAYWGWIWWKQRAQREAAPARKPVAPQKVNCVYDWTPVIPQARITNIQLTNKTAQH